MQIATSNIELDIEKIVLEMKKIERIVENKLYVLIEKNFNCSLFEWPRHQI